MVNHNDDHTSAPADALAFEYALGRAYDAARLNLLERVQARIAHAAPLLAGPPPLIHSLTLQPDLASKSFAAPLLNPSINPLSSPLTHPISSQLS